MELWISEFTALRLYIRLLAIWPSQSTYLPRYFHSRTVGQAGQGRIGSEDWQYISFPNYPRTSEAYATTTGSVYLHSGYHRPHTSLLESWSRGVSLLGESSAMLVLYLMYTIILQCWGYYSLNSPLTYVVGYCLMGLGLEGWHRRRLRDIDGLLAIWCRFFRIQSFFTSYFVHVMWKY